MKATANKQPVVATDPGKNGAVVWGTTLEDVQWEKTPDTLQGVWLLHARIRDQFAGCKTPVAWLEKNTGYMGGIKSSTKRKGEENSEAGGVSPKSLYVFGLATGSIAMAQVAAGFSVRYATPIKWMNAAQISRVSKQLMTPGQWKNHLKSVAVERFPRVKVTLANADALLIYYAVVTGWLR